MTLSLALLALATMPHSDTASLPAQASTRSVTVEFARQWLALLDEERWDESYRETSKAFQNLNTAEVWAAASREGRAPFGAAISRTLLSEESVPAPPSGYRVVKFQTHFADGRETVETVTLDRDHGQ